ncbi:peptidoglycan/LPS O-acetylase OafA/YrhL [Pseudomonas baetica]|uniref:Peptidoglycan/LPS O-acetylase OafA/YrhL n=1 Tax=Pseudomonas baetica TaxID=674054 RepID=A0ABX4Q789_9PSED|nr:acyltransferase family protein [Pseudomonas baetica]PKA72626.1 peptidoglycan/LPS O-acetylase OafA/YrhL [Pseudomonas baetica]PTC16937.1 acyltransferase [Pseudomonas baetica]
MLFRKNINALRALAVLSVVLFHFKIPGFGGGFAGVDVFFVISGFLMTGLIFNGLQQQRFSLPGFYASRARRIIPALLTLCIVLLMFGYVYLPLEDFRETIRTLKSSLLFSSNFTFAKDGNYFDAPLHENWLLHTWSLSVEWQFYLLYPVLIMGFYKFLGAQKTRVALIALALLSFAASVVLSKTHPVFAFYMLPTRAWEMIAGGMVFLYPLRLGSRNGSICEGLGLLAIFTSVLCFSQDDLWPGYLALLPVLGTMLVIYGNTQSVFSRNHTMQFIGSISYSVYLWHWPLVVLLYLCGLLSSWPHVLGAIVLSLVLGALSYYLIESRVSKVTTAPRTLLKFASWTVAVIGLSALSASLVKKYPDARLAFVDLGQPEYTSKLYPQECYPNAYAAADCKLGTGDVSVILFGDSHAQSTAAAVQIDNPQAALSWSLGGCPALQNFAMRDKDLESKCRAFNHEKLQVLKDSFQEVPVVLFSRAALYADPSRNNPWRIHFPDSPLVGESAFIDAYITEYANTVCAIAENHPVYIVKPIPEMPFSVYKGLNLNQRLFQQTADISISLLDYGKRNRIANYTIETVARRCNASVIDPTPYLCPNGNCMGSRDGVPLYFDDNHLVDAGNQQLKGLFKGLIKPI